MNNIHRWVPITLASVGLSAFTNGCMTLVGDGDYSVVNDSGAGTDASDTGATPSGDASGADVRSDATSDAALDGSADGPTLSPDAGDSGPNRLDGGVDAYVGSGDGGPNVHDANSDSGDSSVDHTDGSIVPDGAADALSCAASGTVACGSACVDLSSDNSNCGSCGNACGATQACYAGACCTSGAQCSGCESTYPYFCATPKPACWNSPPNCASIVVCPDGTMHGCVVDGGTFDCDAGDGGECFLDAAPPPPSCGTLTACGSACVNLTSDNSNCGSCGNACGTGKGCYKGSCCTSGAQCASCDTGYPYYCSIPESSCWSQLPNCANNVLCPDGTLHGCIGEGHYDCTLAECLVDAGAPPDAGDGGSGPAPCATGIYTTGGACSVPVAIAAGLFHTCTLLSGGQVACWGWNQLGQVGNGTEVNALMPAVVSGVPVATSIVVGSDATFALTGTGTWEMWGSGSTTITALSALGGVSKLAVGLGYGCFVTASATVECWGDNTDGELGDGTTTTRSTLAVVPGLTGVAGIAARWNNTWALTSGGTLAAWGNNDNGQLGDGTVLGRLSPEALAGLTGVVAVAPSAGGDHTCALKNDGTVECWGNNAYGQLGNGTTTNQLTPAIVSGLTGATEVSCGLSHCCALITSGTVACWGGNLDGELGNGALVNSSVPVTVANVTGATAIAATDSSTCAIVNGTVECWGYNVDGELGNGTTTNSSTPVPVTW